MTQRYHVGSLPDSLSAVNPKRLAQVLAENGHLIDVMGRATIEAVLLMCAAQVAGPKQQGENTDRGVAGRSGRMKCQTRGMASRANEAMGNDGRLADRMLELVADWARSIDR